LLIEEVAKSNQVKMCKKLDRSKEAQISRVWQYLDHHTDEEGETKYYHSGMISIVVMMQHIFRSKRKVRLTKQIELKL
jgi:hypothetical protein